MKITIINVNIIYLYDFLIKIKIHKKYEFPLIKTNI